MVKWQTKRIRKIYEDRNFHIRKNLCVHSTKGVEHEFFIVDTFNWMNVIAINDDNKFVLVKQHRLGANEVMIEVPAGVIDLEEKPEKCAERALAEETGFCGGEITPLKVLWTNPAIMSNKTHFVLIEGCGRNKCHDYTPSENIDVVIADKDEVVEMIRNGTINHAITVAALTVYFLSEQNRFGRVVL